MNIIVVDKCTNYCKYCFASSVMAKTDAKSILPQSDIQYLTDFVSRSGPEFRVNILGGESLLYPHLAELVQALLQLDNVSGICIFTGGIASSRAMERIVDVCDARVEFLFNMNEKQDYRTTREYDLVIKNCELALANGVRCGFGYNVYKLGFNGEEILDLCTDFGVDTLRWTVAYPELVPNSYSETLAPSQYRDGAIEAFEFLESAYKRGIKAGLDCPLPKCFFSGEQLARLALTQPLTVQSIRSCGPVIDVSPELEVFRCFALSDVKRKHLSEFRKFSEIVQYYNANVDETLGIPEVFPACATCEFAVDRSCFGGCIAHSEKALGRRRTSRDLIESMYQAVSAGEFDAALHAYEENKVVLSRRPLAEYLVSKAYAAHGDLDRAVMHARRAVNIKSGERPSDSLLHHLRDLTSRRDGFQEPVSADSI